MAFNETFGGQNIFPSQLTLLELDLTADATLQWPVEQAIAGVPVFADIIDVTADAARTITFPDATLAGPGQATLINNLSAFTITLEDADGNTIGAVPSGQVWQLYLQDNSDAAGDWATFQFGTGVSSATAAALAGAGLVAITTTLNVRTLPEEQAATPYAVVNADRAKTKIWTGGVGTFNLPDPATLGSSWMVYIRNGGSGDLTIDTAAGYINTSGVTSITLAPGGSLLMVSAGTYWFTLSESSSSTGSFSFIAISVAGAAGDYTLSGAELNRISYRLTGALTGNRNIVVPNTVQQYWVSNQTSGAFTLTVKTALGTGVAIPQGYAAIVSCDGVNVVAWEGDPLTAVIPPTMGGTGLSAYALADIIYASAANVLARLPASAIATRYLSNTGAGNIPAWAQVNLANGVTGLLPFANLADGSALSVLGRSVNSAGVMAAIVGAANEVLRVNAAGNVLGFGAINLAVAAAVTGILAATNGGTGLGSYAQGDIIYSSAANVLSALAKDATGVKYLSNQGASNGPAWLANQFGLQTPLAASYTLSADAAGVIQYESSGTTTVEIDTNANVPFPLGTLIPLSNGASSGAMTVTPLGGVTLYAQGASRASFVIPAGYNGVLRKVETNVWVLFTDAPPTGTAETVYAGYVDSAAAAEQVPSGWSVANTGTGLYTVTHNLALAGANDLSIMLTLIRALADDTFINVIAPGVNSFTLGINDSGGGATDSAFFFMCKRNV